MLSPFPQQRSMNLSAIQSWIGCYVERKGKSAYCDVIPIDFRKTSRSMHLLSQAKRNSNSSAIRSWIACFRERKSWLKGRLRESQENRWKMTDLEIRKRSRTTAPPLLGSLILRMIVIVGMRFLRRLVRRVLHYLENRKQ